MEEIVIVEGKQFKLTTDRPLTAEQKAQTIAEIRKQTGCGTCGPKVAKMGNDWQYGGIKSLTLSCPASGASGGSAATAKASGGTVTMSAIPTQGVAPYSLIYRKTPAGSYTDGDAGATETISRAVLAAPGAPYIDPAGMTTPGADTTGVYGNILEGSTVTRIYTLIGADINGATSKTSGEGATIIFASTITDSCATPATCTNFCKIFVACPTPTCDFTVT